MAELADALASGASVPRTCWFNSSRGHQNDDQPIRVGFLMTISYESFVLMISFTAAGLALP